MSIHWLSEARIAAMIEERIKVHEESWAGLIRDLAREIAREEIRAAAEKESKLADSLVETFKWQKIQAQQEARSAALEEAAALFDDPRTSDYVSKAFAAHSIRALRAAPQPDYAAHGMAEKPSPARENCIEPKRRRDDGWPCPKCGDWCYAQDGNDPRGHNQCPPPHTSTTPFDNLPMPEKLRRMTMLADHRLTVCLNLGTQLSEAQKERDDAIYHRNTAMVDARVAKEERDQWAKQHETSRQVWLSSTEDIRKERDAASKRLAEANQALDEIRDYFREAKDGIVTTTGMVKRIEDAVKRTGRLAPGEQR